MRGTTIADELNAHRRDCVRCDIVIDAHKARSAPWYSWRPTPGSRANESTPSGLCPNGRQLFEAWRASCKRLG